MYGDIPYILYGAGEFTCLLLKSSVSIALTDDDKSMIEEAAAISNQSVSQFMLNSASQRAAEVIEQHRRVILNEESWTRVMDALSNPPSPGEKLKRAAKRLQGM